MPYLYVYRDRDGMGVQDPAIRAYGSPWIDRVCEREPGSPWKHGKTIVRFTDGTRVVVRTRLLRKAI